MSGECCGELERELEPGQRRGQTQPQWKRHEQGQDQAQDHKQRHGQKQRQEQEQRQDQSRNQSQNQNRFHNRDQEQDQRQRQRAGAPALRFVIPWMMAVAEEEQAWWERRKRNPKRRGELSQAAFLLKGQSLGLGLAVPWGDSEKCDFIVWAGRGARLLRVQVKATGRLHRGGYDVQPVYSTRGEGKKAYTAEEIDVLAAHVVLEGSAGEVWYLLPVEAFAGVKSLRFFPGLQGKDPRWERYREAWRWLGLER